MARTPFADHPFVVTIPAVQATWDAERTRLAGPSDPAARAGAAKAGQDLGCPHRAGYALWQQAQAQLAAGQPATTAAAVPRQPPTATRRCWPRSARWRSGPNPAPDLGGRGPPANAATGGRGTAAVRADRPELAVLRLVAAGRSNAQIGELYISPRTAGVHPSRCWPTGHWQPGSTSHACYGYEQAAVDVGCGTGVLAGEAGLRFACVTGWTPMRAWPSPRARLVHDLAGDHPSVRLPGVRRGGR
jgi:DNA-binding NarL/FixJ family response regulator